MINVHYKVYIDKEVTYESSDQKYKAYCALHNKSLCIIMM